MWNKRSLTFMIWSPVRSPSCSAALSSWTPAMKIPTSFPPASLRPTLSPFWKRTITVFGLDDESKISLYIATEKTGKKTEINIEFKLWVTGLRAQRELIKKMCGQNQSPWITLRYTDPYTSWSSMLGFSGTLGGAWTFGATVTAGTAQTESNKTCYEVMSCSIYIFV